MTIKYSDWYSTQFLNDEDIREETAQEILNDCEEELSTEEKTDLNISKILRDLKK